MPPQSITGLENPPAAGPPYYDESRGEWVVSRYRDVLAALREPLLWPAAQPGDDSNSGRERCDHSERHPESRQRHALSGYHAQYIRGSRS